MVKTRVLGVLALFASFAVAISGATDPDARAALWVGVGCAAASAAFGFGWIAWRLRNGPPPVKQTDRSDYAPGWVRALAVSLPVVLLASPLRGLTEAVFIVGAGLAGGTMLAAGLLLPETSGPGEATPNRSTDTP